MVKKFGTAPKILAGRGSANFLISLQRNHFKPQCLPGHAFYRTAEHFCTPPQKHTPEGLVASTLGQRNLLNRNLQPNKLVRSLLPSSKSNSTRTRAKSNRKLHDVKEPGFEHSLTGYITVGRLKK